LASMHDERKGSKIQLILAITEEAISSVIYPFLALRTFRIF